MLSIKQKYQHSYMKNYMRRTKQCEYCNRDYKLFSYYRHCKTPKHLNNIKMKELQDIIEKNSYIDGEGDGIVHD